MKYFMDMLRHLNRGEGNRVKPLMQKIYCFPVRREERRIGHEQSPSRESAIWTLLTQYMGDNLIHLNSRRFRAYCRWAELFLMAIFKGGTGTYKTLNHGSLARL